MISVVIIKVNKLALSRSVLETKFYSDPNQIFIEME